ncbi:hypothetical protein IF2G_02633 [Cordyceps javanica]|nr:hypothetical protein IF2G_02633 [Cordyceps javanica]
MNGGCSGQPAHRHRRFLNLARGAATATVGGQPVRPWPSERAGKSTLPRYPTLALHARWRLVRWAFFLFKLRCSLGSSPCVDRASSNEADFLASPTDELKIGTKGHSPYDTSASLFLSSVLFYPDTMHTAAAEKRAMYDRVRIPVLPCAWTRRTPLSIRVSGYEERKIFTQCGRAKDVFE